MKQPDNKSRSFDYRSKETNPETAYQLGNPDLPFATKRPEFEQFLTDMVEHDIPVGIVTAETGAGKTTTAPQAAYETGLFKTIYVAEPRIILARETRKRIVHEMSESLGYDASRLVGYGTSSESDLHDDNKIIIGTHGYISQRLIHSDEHDLNDTLLLADEYHDREVEGDVAVEVAKNKGVPTVLMSATIDTDRLSQFHCSYDGQRPAPTLAIEGRTYPVERRQMEDSTEAVAWAVNNGLTVLYYLPGKYDIDAEIGRVTRMAEVRHTPLPLHGEQTAEEQSRIFKEHAYPKVIYSTNVGDSGMTPDVDVVVDSGLTKKVVLRGGVETLTTQLTSHATSKQREGRCGRNKPGIYIEAPYSGAPAELIGQTRADYSSPEIYDKRLEGVSLRLAQAGLDLYTLDLPDRPKEREIDRANNRLRNLGAMAIDASITDIGKEMAHLPLDPNLARMVVASRDFSDDIHRLMIAGAAVAQLGGVGARMKDKEQWRRLSKDRTSELLRDLDVYMRALHMNDDQRANYNILDQKMRKVQRQIDVVAEREHIDMEYFDRIPTEVERQQLLECMASGIDEIFVHRGKGIYRDYKRNQKRKLPHNITLGGSRIVAGKAWNKDKVRQNTMKTEYLINNAMAVDVETLMRVAPERCSYKDVDYELDEQGNILVHRQVVFSDIPTTMNIVRPLQESTPELREFIINGLFQESLPNEAALPDEMQKFRREILELRDYEHRATEQLDVEGLLQDIQAEIKTLVPKSAQTMEQIIQYVDANYIRGFMSNEQRRSIRANSPDKLTLDGIDGRQFTVAINYRDHIAEVTVADYDEVRNLPAFISELDGRVVTVRVAGSAKVESYQSVTSGKYAGSRDDRRGITSTPNTGYAPKVNFSSRFNHIKNKAHQIARRR